MCKHLDGMSWVFFYRNTCRTFTLGLPWWLSGKEPACQCRRCRRFRSDLWVGKIPWRWAWHPLQYSFFFFMVYSNFIVIIFYNIILVLPYINMNLPWVYMCSPSWTPLPPPSPYHPSGSSQCTSPKLPVSCIKPGLAIRFLYDIIHVLMPFSQIIPPTTESKRLFYISVSLLLSHIQGYRYHLSKFHTFSIKITCLYLEMVFCLYFWKHTSSLIASDSSFLSQVS